MKKELMWEARIFYLVALVIILLASLVLRVCLGMSGEPFIITTVPSMCTALISSLMIFSLEFVLWYIFRLKGKHLSGFQIGKR